jgi:acyl-CoA synthetase (AMP-forming)/AMP-acid ligase II
MTMSDMLTRHARIQPDQVFLVDRSARRTYGHMHERVSRLANVLAARGVGPGDRVAVLGLNCIGVVEAWIAALRLGGIAVPVNFRLVPAEIAYVLNDSGARALVVDEQMSKAAQAALQQAPDLKAVLTMGAQLEESLAAAASAHEEVLVSDEDPAFIMYTSGTTGFPKGAVLTHRNLLMHAFSNSVEINTPKDDVWLAAAPMFHIAGLAGMYPSLVMGGKTVIPPSGGFDPAQMLRLLSEEQVTTCFMVPTQWQAICSLPDLASYDLSRLRRISWGAAPASTRLLRTMMQKFPDAELLTSFGQTECSPVVCILAGADALRKIGSIGKPMLNVEVRVVDDDMRDVPQGAVGEFVYRSPMVMKEYWNKPAETAEAFRGGWFHSGDLVRQDAEGFYYVVDRKKDMIISGGENIYCAEVENALASHPQVADVALIGVPDPQWGESPLALIVPADRGSPPSARDIEDFSRRHLAGYKRPRRVVIVDDLPRNASGKVLKARLREEYGAARVASEPAL